MQADLLEGLCFICFFKYKIILIQCFCTLGYSKNLYKVLLIAPVIVSSQNVPSRSDSVSDGDKLITVDEAIETIGELCAICLEFLIEMYIYNVKASPVVDVCLSTNPPTSIRFLFCGCGYGAFSHQLSISACKIYF